MVGLCFSGDFSLCFFPDATHGAGRVLPAKNWGSFVGGVGKIHQLR